MQHIEAKRFQTEFPDWAFRERLLMRTLDETPESILQKYVREDGSMLWPVQPGHADVDGLDDMYESFHNWPLYYLLGGDERFLSASHKEFDAITRQFSRVPCGHGHSVVRREYEQGYDWMHQGEGYLFFYLLNLADPNDPVNKARSVRFASFYTGEDEHARNYDARLRMMRCCYLGSEGPAYRNFGDGEAAPWAYADWKEYYGLPYDDVPGVRTVRDLKDPDKAAAMGRALKERLQHSDTAINLMCTALVMNAYLHTGDDRYARFIDEYVGAWRERMAQNGGILPDNVGPDGCVGSAMGGNWYGGHYGWTWPHGFYFLGEAMAVAGEIQCLLHGSPDAMDWLRDQVQALMRLGVEQNGTLFIPHKHSVPGALHAHRAYNPDYDCVNGRVLTTGQAEEGLENFLERDGWFEFAPMRPVSLAHLYAVTRSDADLALVRRLRNLERPDWDRVRAFYAKDQGGHEAAWLEYLNGAYPAYPLDVLDHALTQVYARMKAIREDAQDPSTYSDSYLQQRNPVNTEALVHLTLGGLPPVYNGGLLLVTLRYYDAEALRPGLPPDVAALVSELHPDFAVVTLVNLHPAKPRKLILQGGAFGEHQITHAEYQEPGGEPETLCVDSPWLAVSLCAASVLTCKLWMKRFSRKPSYQTPFDDEGGSL